MNLLSMFQDNEDIEPFIERRSPDAEGRLRVIRASGETVTLGEDEWALDEKRSRIYFITHKNPELNSAQSFVASDPPVSAHVPMGTLTAADNRAEKTEQDAYSPFDIVRYSTVVNTSNSPEVTHTFTGSVIEIWLDDEDTRFWPYRTLKYLLP